MPDPIVSVTPDALTLAPGESAQVTVTVDPASPSGEGSVTIPVTVPSLYDHIWEGPSAVVVPVGEHHLIRGVLDQTDSIHVRGLLTIDPDATIDGHDQFDIHTHGGRIVAAGRERTAWCLWGDPVVGWEIGDRLLITPNVPGEYEMVEGLWTGDWDTLVRPDVSPDFILRDGRVMRPEVVNPSQSLTIKNVTRIMFHAEDGVPAAQTLRWLRILDSGVPDTADVGGFYPIHFHLNGEASRGSVLEGVVVEGGKQYAFVPHGSHGINFIRCAAVNTRRDAYWWDPPGTKFYVGGGLDASNDIIYDHCVALGINTDRSTTAGFRLPEGLGNKALFCRAAAFPKPGADGTGAHWRFSTDPWEFSDFVTHNIEWNGLSVWDNSTDLHLIERVLAYNCGHVNPADGKAYGAEYDHGAYGNLYHYRDIYGDKFRLHAKSEASTGEIDFLTIEQANLLVLEVVKHQLGRFRPIHVTDSQIGQVVYNEAGGNPSWIKYRDCGLAPSDFTLTIIHPGSLIEILESDVLMHRWQSGVWG